MYCLIYISSATTPLDKATIEEILEKARTRNKEDEVTGLLLYQGGNILQYLEGPKDAVESCYERISKDSRHRQITKLLTAEREARLFDEWSMGYKDLKDEDCEGEFREFWNEKLGSVDPAQKTDALLKFIMRFSENNR